MTNSFKPEGDDENLPDPDVLLDGLAEYVNPGRARIYRLMGMTNVEWFAEGSKVVDTEGREFIDLCAGYAVMNAGHRHPRILEAVQDQMSRLALSTRTMLSAGEVELAGRLAELTPGELSRSFFCATGAEAVEVALKMARAHTDRENIVAAEHGFHGKTMGALSATGKGDYREPFEPLVPGFAHAPFGDIEAMDEAVDQKTAAVILEPIQGEAGAVAPDDDYLAQVREICSEAGALLILDEIQTGLGRTGKNFACEHYGVVPDIMTLAKGLGGGIMPVGACIARPEVFDIFDEHPWVHSSTTGGNPLACAAATAFLDVLVEENLAQEAAEKGEIVRERLLKLISDHPEVISDISGKGLLQGVKFTQPAGGLTVLMQLFERGVLVIPSLMNWSVMRIAPPLTIPVEKLERGMDIIEQTVSDTKSQLT